MIDIGIGGGREGAGSNITISGGDVTATGGDYGAGIGGGKYGNASDITVSVNTVEAFGGVSATDIGGGFQGTSSNITLPSAPDPEEIIPPKTGDDFNLTLWMAIVLLSAAGIVILNGKRKANSSR